MKDRDFVCDDCGRAFISKSPNAKYCKDCRIKRFVRKAEPRQVACAYILCGVVFTTSQPGARYHSNRCRVADFRRTLALEAEYGTAIPR